MKTPTWESSPGALLAFLNSTDATAVRLTDLYTFTTAANVSYRYTSGDTAISVYGQSFLLGPTLTRSEITLGVGIEVDTMTLTIGADSSVLMGSMPIVSAFDGGMMDNGLVESERLFSKADGTPVGTILMFLGRVGTVSSETNQVTAEVRSFLELLNVMVPSAIYQPACRNTLFDLNCGLLKATFAISKPATVATGATRQTFSADFTATAGATAGYFDLGVATCTAGANAGIARTIKRHTGTGTGVIEVIAPWPSAVSVGDAFTFTPGCDKTKATCTAKYSNLVHFSAEPYVPVPQSVT